MSRRHAVVSGDTLGAISVRYLGTFSQWRKIVDANPQLANRRTASDGSPLIYVGDVLIIPENITERPAAPQTAQTIAITDDEQDVSIVIDGKKFTGFTGYEINLSADSFDTFSFSAPYDIAAKDLKDAIMPFAFKTCEVYYLGELLFKGYLLTPDPELQAGATEITLQGYPLCAVLNDCTIPPSKYPLEYYNVTLKDIADPLADIYGIKIIYKDGAGDPFTEVGIEPNEKILSFLLKLAQQRQFLFTNDENGRLVFYKPKDESAFMQFKEGSVPLLSIMPQFNAQGFYSHITGHTKNDTLLEPLSFTFENKYLINKGVIRHDTIMVDDAETAAELEKAVTSHAGRMFADCIAYNLKCETHLNADNKLFKKGMTVCVEAPGAMITKQTNLKARNIKLTRTIEGKTTELDLVLPGSFTDKPPEVLPWD
jgi:prophage tail gpP-like protein